MKNSINRCNKNVWCGAMSFLGDQVGQASPNRERARAPCRIIFIRITKGEVRILPLPPHGNHPSYRL
jgi:hypothetical protein